MTQWLMKNYETLKYKLVIRQECNLVAKIGQSLVRPYQRKEEERVCRFLCITELVWPHEEF